MEQITAVSFCEGPTHLAAHRKWAWCGGGGVTQGEHGVAEEFLCDVIAVRHAGGSSVDGSKVRGNGSWRWRKVSLVVEDAWLAR